MPHFIKCFTNITEDCPNIFFRSKSFTKFMIHKRQLIDCRVVWPKTRLILAQNFVLAKIIVYLLNITCSRILLGTGRSDTGL